MTTPESTIVAPERSPTPFSDTTHAMPETPRATDPRRDRTRQRHWAAFALIGIQLGLALVVVRLYQLQSRSFFAVMVLMVGGFLVHAALPLRLRESFFAAISVVSVPLVFGASTGARVLLLGGVVVAACHLPLRFWFRVAIVTALGALLMLLRVDAWMPFSGAAALPDGAWAILGSMLMFRVAVYLQALRTRAPDEPQPTVAATTAYFFMAPNVVFPLFPVVDYGLFRKSFFDGPALEIYSTGTKWIARGLMHLILYRLVYLHFALDPAVVRDLGDVLQYVLATYLLYLRVSGSFHLIVGVLHLYGYRLPETHHLYYLAESFNDYWRRINIYWKDFMMKLVYYPSFFLLRKRTVSATVPMVGATMAVFAATWFLHAYQWLWLRGEFPLELPDVLFWGILGTLVVWNALRERSRGRKRVTEASMRWSWSRAVRVFATFVSLCLLWSLWSADSVAGWIVMWRAATFAGSRDLLTLGAMVAGGLLVAGWPWGRRRMSGVGALPWYRTDASRSLALMSVVCMLGLPPVQRLFRPSVESVLASLQHTQLNATDAAKMHRGYYEKMDLQARQSVDLWEAASQRPADFTSFTETRGYRPRSDFLGADNRPSTVVTSRGVQFTINRWGMRGGDVAPAKSPGVVRVLFVGPSYIFGLGVSDSTTLPAWLQRRLDASGAAPAGTRYEVLNLAVSGTAITQALALLDDRGFDFAPDVVVLGIDSLVPSHVIQHMSSTLRRGIPIPYPGLVELLGRNGIDVGPRVGLPLPFDGLRAIARAAGVPVRTPRAEIDQRIMMAADDIVAWTMGELARRIRAHGAVPVAVAMDLVRSGPVHTAPSFANLMTTASEVGFKLADVRDVWDGRDAQTLKVAPWDDHPNDLGYRLLADRLFDELASQHVITGRIATP